VVPKEVTNSLARGRLDKLPLVDLEERNEIPTDANNDEFLGGKAKGNTGQCETRLAQENDGGVLHVSRDESPLHEIKEGLELGSEPGSPPNEDYKCSHLPFSFMPDTSDASSTPRRNTRTSEIKSATPRRKVSVFRRRSICAPGPLSRIGPGINTSCAFASDYSPIRPRISKGAIMAPYPSSLSLRETPLSSAEMPPVSDPATPFSPPFNFMSGDDFPQQSNFNSQRTEHIMPNANILSPQGNLASVVKLIFRFAVEWLLSWRTTALDNDVSLPLSLPSPIPSSPHDSRFNSRPTSSHLYSAEERSVTPRLTRRRKLSIPSRVSASSLPLPPTSNRSFLRTNERTSSDLNEHELEGAASRNKSSSGQGVNSDYVKNPSGILPGPPNGWEGFFQPKVGEWKCKACFYMNSEEAMTCDSCTALKERTDNKDGKGKEHNVDSPILPWVDMSLFGDDEKDQSEHSARSPAGTHSSDAGSNKEENEASGIVGRDATIASESVEAEATRDNGATSKRAKVNNDGNANRKGVRPSPKLAKDRSQNQGATISSKRIKRDSAAQINTQNHPNAMSQDSPDSSGSKKRNKSDGDGDLNQASKMAREDVDGSEMAMDDTSLHNSSTSSIETMDVDGLS